MQSSNIPVKFPIPFANAASGTYKHQVPTASQIGITDGAASLTDGFVPDNFIPVASGGIPPFGIDFNGILFQATAWARWQAAGGPIFYDGTFSAAIGGYPLGVRAVSTVNPALTWVSTVENNTTDPDGGSAAGWVVLGDLGHSYVANGGYMTIGQFIINFGHVGLSGTSGHIAVTFAKPFTSVVLWPGAVNDCGPAFPSATAGVGNLSLTGMNVGMSNAPTTSGGAFAPAGAGTAAFWWAAGI